MLERVIVGIWQGGGFRNVGFGLLGTWKSLRLLSTLGRSFYLLVFIWERGIAWAVYYSFCR